ncbi:type IV pilin [Halorussus halophilus]|uniref:type IV pilin n=1 Tax=Halorussus halophilus TaxID=2650975 RepID=UPI00130114E5|nr:type IV pilin [Halorussus halophilus]
MSSRALSPVLGTVLLLLVTTILAGAVGVAALGTTMPTPPPNVAIDVQVDGTTKTLTFAHRGGETLDVRELSIQIAIDGVALDSQPPVPFFSSEGFRPGPTGPFNSAADPNWSAGETASFRLASTNSPTLSRGARVTVKIYVGESLIGREETTV